MSEIQLSNEQQQQLASLATALAGDAALRGRFTADVRGVLAEFGLSALLPEGVDYEAVLDEAEVSGFALSATGHSDSTTSHWDYTHTDITTGNFAGFRIAPRLF